MHLITKVQKQRISAELDKLSPQGLKLLALFREQIDQNTPLCKIVAGCLISRFSTSFIMVAKGWMAAQGASESDIKCVGNIIRYTGAWGAWPVDY